MIKPIVLSLKQFRHLVYAFMKGKEFIYIGRSSSGLTRPFGPHKARKGATHVRIYLAKSKKHSEEIESSLILKYTPKLNKHGLQPSRQQAVLDIIRKYRRIVNPSIREIARHLHKSPSTIYLHVTALRRKGWLNEHEE